MTKKVGVNVLVDPRLVAICLDNLLHPPNRKRRAPGRFKQKSVLRSGVKVGLKHQPKISWK